LAVGTQRDFQQPLHQVNGGFRAALLNGSAGPIPAIEL